MATINVSIPDQLKQDAETLIASGLYVPFSDVVHDSLRQVVEKNKYDIMAEEAKREIKERKAIVLKTKKDIEDYFNTV